MPFWDAFLPKVGCPIGVSFIFSIRNCLPFRRESTTNSDNFLGKLASEVYDKVTQFSLGKSCHFSIFGEKIRTFWKNEKSLNFVVDIRPETGGVRLTTLRQFRHGAFGGIFFQTELAQKFRLKKWSNSKPKFEFRAVASLRQNDTTKKSAFFWKNCFS